MVPISHLLPRKPVDLLVTKAWERNKLLSLEDFVTSVIFFCDFLWSPPVVDESQWKLPLLGWACCCWGQNHTFYSSCSFYFHASSEIALVPVVTSLIRSSKSHKNSVSHLAWDWMILMHFFQGGGKGTFHSVAATCFGLKILEIHSCFGNKFVLFTNSSAGAMSSDSGPGGFRPFRLGAHGRFSPGFWMQRLKNCWVCRELVSRAVCWGEEWGTRHGQNKIDLWFPKFRCLGVFQGDKRLLNCNVQGVCPQLCFGSCLYFWFPVSWIMGFRV